MSDEIRIPLAEVVGEIREVLRVTFEAERLGLARILPPGSMIGEHHIAQSVAYEYIAGESEAYQLALSNLARNLAHRLVTRGWGG